MSAMKRIADKLCVLVCCCALAASIGAEPVSMPGVVLILMCVTASAVFEFCPRSMRPVCPIAICLAVVALPTTGMALLPLAAYDLTRVGEEKHTLENDLLRCAVPHAAWVLSLVVIASWEGLPPMDVTLTAGLCTMSAILSWRTGVLLSQEKELHALRDSLQEKIDLLRHKNGELIDASDQMARTATLTERARIAREIHDNVGHLLTRSFLQVKALQVVHGDDKRIIDELTQVEGSLQEALDTMRSSVHALHDDSIDLAAELERLAATSGVKDVDVRYEVDNQVPAPIATCIISVVREALTNVIRHSDATSASVRVTEHPAIWQVIVTDEGRAVGGPAIGEGLGLASMRERVEGLGGTFRVTPGKLTTTDRTGFSVFASIPKFRR